MKTIVEGDLVSSKAGSYPEPTLRPEMIQVVPVRYIHEGGEDETELTVFLKTGIQQLNITISCKEWDEFTAKVGEEIEKINNIKVVVR